MYPGPWTKHWKGWKGHFNNLWNRTDDMQRACLEALLVEPRADQQHLTLHTGLEKTVRRAVQMMLRHELILREQDETYRIAVPIFRKWVERNA